MAEMTRGRGRPSTSLLSRDLICRTGLELLDSQGESALSMARIARELDVKPASLYNHVSSREQVVEGIRALIVARIELPDFEGHSWGVALELWAQSYRSALGAHPHAIHLLATTPIRAETSMRMYDSVIRGLSQAGWAKAESLDVIVVLESFLLGSALDLAAPPLMYSSEGHAEEFPALTSALAERGMGPDPDSAFDLGLGLLLNSLAARRHA